MPLQPGAGRQVITANIREGYKSWQQKGTFGGRRIRSRKKALAQIIAAAERNADQYRPPRMKA